MPASASRSGTAMARRRRSTSSSPGPGGSGGKDEVDLAPLDAVRVPPKSMRAFEAGPDGLRFLAFGSPGNGATDADMQPGWWGD